ncbi:hypothetical protein LINGRAHAP2_LOCUS2794, partial [Linum grandiflorum]
VRRDRSRRSSSRGNGGRKGRRLGRRGTDGKEEALGEMEEEDKEKGKESSGAIAVAGKPGRGIGSAIQEQRLESLAGLRARSESIVETRKGEICLIRCFV